MPTRPAGCAEPIKSWVRKLGGEGDKVMSVTKVEDLPIVKSHMIEGARHL